MMDQHGSSSGAGRREFVKGAVALVLGAGALLTPLLAGLRVFLDPLGRRSQKQLAVRITSLGALPEDGTPRKFAVVTKRVDAWTKTPEAPVGAVYLRRLSGDKVQALNVVCPHAGCFVGYSAAKGGFLCPCHNSFFALDGSIRDPKSPSRRGLDELEVEIRGGTEVWVKFLNFRTHVAEKIPAA